MSAAEAWQDAAMLQLQSELQKRIAKYLDVEWKDGFFERDHGPPTWRQTDHEGHRIPQAAVRREWIDSIRTQPFEESAQQKHDRTAWTRIKKEIDDKWGTTYDERFKLCHKYILEYLQVLDKANPGHIQSLMQDQINRHKTRERHHLDSVISDQVDTLDIYEIETLNDVADILTVNPAFGNFWNVLQPLEAEFVNKMSGSGKRENSHIGMAPIDFDAPDGRNEGYLPPLHYGDLALDKLGKPDSQLPPLPEDAGRAPELSANPDPEALLKATLWNRASIRRNDAKRNREDARNMTRRSYKHLRNVLAAEKSVLHNPRLPLRRFKIAREVPGTEQLQLKNPDTEEFKLRDKASRHNRYKEKDQVRRRLFAGLFPGMANYEKVKMLHQLEHEREQKFLETIPKEEDLFKIDRAVEARIMLKPMTVNPAGTTRFVGRADFKPDKTLPLATIDLLEKATRLAANTPIGLPRDYPVQPVERFLHDLMSKNTRRIDFASEVQDPDKVKRIDFLNGQNRYLVEQFQQTIKYPQQKQIYRARDEDPSITHKVSVYMPIRYHLEDKHQGLAVSGKDTTADKSWPMTMTPDLLLHGVVEEDHEKVKDRFNGHGLVDYFINAADEGRTDEWLAEQTPDTQWMFEAGAFTYPPLGYPAPMSDRGEIFDFES